MPIIGRYIRKDILKYENNNLYMYCSNNPIKNIDPMGLIDREYFGNVQKVRHGGLSGIRSGFICTA